MSRVRLVPMTPERYLAWAPESIAGFARHQADAGVLPLAEAQETAAREFDRLLPDGLRTVGHHLWSAFAGEQEVGHLWLALRAGSPGRAFVYDVAVSEEVRGRGLGRAIMLAGEQSARDLGAVEVQLNVFGHNATARRLYASLGYTTVSTVMTRRLDAAPPEPGADSPVVRLDPMSPEEFDVYRARAENSYADSIAASGLMSAEEARTKAAEDYANLLPDGVRSVGNHLWTVRDGSLDVGLVWVRVSERADGRHAFGYDLLVHERLRRHGYGRATLVATERACRGLGVRSVGLNVFGFNHAARALYEQLGFEVSAELLGKRL